LQIGDKSDHSFFGRPEHATNARPTYIADSKTGGADLAAEYAAAFAAGASLFASVNRTAYARTLFRHAQQAFAFAEAYPNKYDVQVARMYVLRVE
jgi:endoglucanase